jgi:hypothetical protein
MWKTLFENYPVHTFAPRQYNDIIVKLVQPLDAGDAAITVREG